MYFTTHFAKCLPKLSVPADIVRVSVNMLDRDVKDAILTTMSDLRSLKLRMDLVTQETVKSGDALKSLACDPLKSLAPEYPGDQLQSPVPECPGDHHQSLVPELPGDHLQFLACDSVESGDQLTSLTCVSGDTLFSLALEPSGDSSVSTTTEWSEETTTTLNEWSGDHLQLLPCESLESGISGTTTTSHETITTSHKTTVTSHKKSATIKSSEDITTLPDCIIVDWSENAASPPATEPGESSGLYIPTSGENLMHNPGGSRKTCDLNTFEIEQFSTNMEDEEPDNSETQDNGVMFVLTNNDIDVSVLWSCNLASHKTSFLETSNEARATRDHSLEKKEAAKNPFSESSESLTEVNKKHTASLTLFDPGGSHGKDLLIVTNSQLYWNLSTVFDPGGVYGGDYNQDSIKVDLISKVILTSFAYQTRACWLHSCKPLESLKCSPTLFDPGGSDVTLKTDLSTFTTDISVPHTERLVKYLSYLLVIYRDELDIKLNPRTVFDPGGFVSMDYYLVNFATILFFINFVKKYSSIRTEERVRKGVRIGN